MCKVVILTHAQSVEIQELQETMGQPSREGCWKKKKAENPSKPDFLLSAKSSAGIAQPTTRWTGGLGAAPARLMVVTSKVVVIPRTALPWQQELF